jgi:GNAT superfamily N-acetyltransferase
MIINLNDEQEQILDDALGEYLEADLGKPARGSVSIGIEENGELVGGAFGGIDFCNIFYIQTLFVKEEHRRKGYARTIMAELEKRAKELGAIIIKLSTYNSHGTEFYEKIGYTRCGSLEVESFSEITFMKKL